jgi:1,4-dihydroxy-2-naphthoate octaprenyltransferase
MRVLRSFCLKIRWHAFCTILCVPREFGAGLFSESLAAAPLRVSARSPTVEEGMAMLHRTQSAAHQIQPPVAPFPILATPDRALPAVSPMARTGNVWAGIWRLADPKISLASMAALFLGACLAAHDGAIAWDWLGLTVAGIFFIEVAKNASGELFDWDSGADLDIRPEDRSPFSGGKRVLVDGLLTRTQTRYVADVAYALGIGTGLGIALWREPHVWWIGLVGVGLAFFYHAPPFKLSYRGWGELAVAAVYGPLIMAGMYLVQRGTLTPQVIVLGLPLGMLIGAFLWISEFPDYLTDRAARKRNLVVVLGRVRASRYFALLIILVQLVIGLLPLAGLPVTVLFGWVAAVPAAFAAQILLTHPEQTQRIIPAQAFTLIAFLLLSLTSGVGVLLAV